MAKLHCAHLEFFLSLKQIFIHPMTEYFRYLYLNSELTQIFSIFPSFIYQKQWIFFLISHFPRFFSVFLKFSILLPSNPRNRSNHRLRYRTFSWWGIRLWMMSVKESLKGEKAHTSIGDNSWEPPISNIPAVDHLVEQSVKEVLFEPSISEVEVQVLVRGWSWVLDEPLKFLKKNLNVFHAYSLVVEFVMIVSGRIKGVCSHVLDMLGQMSQTWKKI